MVWWSSPVFDKLLGGRLPVTQQDKYSLAHLSSLYEQLNKTSVVTERNQAMVVESLRTMAELIIWGEQHDPSFFELFLEKNVSARKERACCGPLFCRAPLPRDSAAAAATAATNSRLLPARCPPYSSERSAWFDHAKRTDGSVPRQPSLAAPSQAAPPQAARQQQLASRFRDLSEENSALEVPAYLPSPPPCCACPEAETLLETRLSA